MANQTSATDLSCFEGIEEPEVRFIVASGTFERDDFQNITKIDQGVFRMTLRHFAGEWWDGDRQTYNRDRQRAEVKGLGRRQMIGESFEYSTTWRSSPSLVGTEHFCHIFQLKATDDDGQSPLVTLSIKKGTGHAAVEYTADFDRDHKKVCTVRTFDWVPDTWQKVCVRITPSETADGEIRVSVNGDAFQGKTRIVLQVPGKVEYRPKWGFYRKITDDLRNGEDFIEHKEVFATEL